MSQFKFKFSLFIEENSATRRKMKNVDVFVKKIVDFQKYFCFELKWAQIKQKKYTNVHRYFVFELKINDKIMLNVRFIITIRFNKSLNHKNLDFYRIIKIIHNFAYKLNFFKSMKAIFSIFHLWLLHLNELKQLFEQQKLNFSSVIVRKKFKWKIEKVVDFKIDKKRNNFYINIKKYLVYRVIYKNWNIWNQIFKWQLYHDLKNAISAIIDYHYFISRKKSFYVIFKRSNN